MSFAESLGPRLLGAEVLVRIAQKRGSGTLQWTDSNSSAGIVFVAGRPQVLLDINGNETGDKGELEKALRTLAIASSGTCTFESQDLSDVVHHESHRLDTLGLVLMAVVRDLQPVQIDSFWDARMRYEVRLTSLFERLAAAVTKFNDFSLERPEGIRTIGQLLAGGTTEKHRAWITLIVLGALEVVNVPEPQSQVSEMEIDDSAESGAIMCAITVARYCSRCFSWSPLRRRPAARPG